MPSPVAVFVNLPLHSQPTLKSYPRVLVFSPEPFNRELGCGITLTNLFAGWPSDRLACVYVYDDVVPDTSVCHCHMSIAQCLSVAPLVNATKHSHSREATQFFRSGLKTVIGNLDKTVGIRQWLNIYPRIPTAVTEWAASFAPQVIYCPLNSAGVLCLFEKWVAIAPVPTVLHVYDDWISVVGDNGSLTGGLFGLVLKHRLRRAFARAAVRMTIGDEMGRQYRQRYGMEFHSYQNPPSAEVWLAHGRNQWASGTPFRFRFFGSIYERGNLEALQAFAEIVEIVGDAGFRVTFELFTTTRGMERYQRGFAGYPSTKFHLAGQKDEYIAQLHGTADALIMAYNSCEHNQHALGLSMPTKLPTSLLSGTPIIAYAPADSALVKLIMQHDCGFHLPQEHSKTTSADRLIMFMSNTRERERLGRRGRALAGRFTANVVRPRFQNEVIQAAEYPSGTPGD